MARFEIISHFEMLLIKVTKSFSDEGIRLCILYDGIADYDIGSGIIAYSEKSKRK